MSSSKPVANICQVISANNSDFVESECSGDEHLPSCSDSGDSDVDQAPGPSKWPKKAPAKLKKRSKATLCDCIENSSFDDKDHVPLAQLRERERLH
ncbi:hypothetical protein RRG08_052964 [Elysia crispata]|uniref:Uncharacterized protein n=1 Tax=Elysia crispata TaxID=231223 RepID=A0AAE1DH93_9GAST|nr:hypothetical protein RRG08_052964 [Elysia crispata]